MIMRNTTPSKLAKKWRKMHLTALNIKMQSPVGLPHYKPMLFTLFELDQPLIMLLVCNWLFFLSVSFPSTAENFATDEVT